MKNLSALIRRHAQVLIYVLTVVIPVTFRTGRRPVIFSKYSGIGDIICTFPAALELKKRHPQSTFIYNCHPDFACLPRMGGITPYVTSNQHIGLVGHWYSFLLSGYYSFASDDDRPDKIPTEVYIKDFGRTFGVEVADDHPCLHCASAVSERIQNLLVEKGLTQKPLIMIHTGPSWPVREWPLESWSALIKKLNEKGYTNIVRLGTGRHLALGEVETGILSGVISLVDQLSLEETTALISEGQLFIGIDSGLLHIAAAVQIPAIGLWGPTSSNLRFSKQNARLFITSTVECQGCHHRVPRLHWITNCPYDIRCMKAISVTQVAEGCLKLLDPALA
jgi:ADP-heptose:LPS heptosyltransferase